MALIKCKECNKEISDKAKQCPHCGFENNIITCPECKKEIENNINTCPNCGFEIQKENKQVKNKFNTGTIIWLVICIIACFGMAFLNGFGDSILGIIVDKSIGYLAILLGISYVVLLVNQNKMSLYILLGINAIILVFSLFPMITVISLLNIFCAIVNATITSLVVRKSLCSNKLNLFGIVSYIATIIILIVVFIFNFSNNTNNSNNNNLSSEEQQIFNTIISFIERNDFYNPSALKVMKLRIEDDGKDYPMLWVRMSGTNKIGGTINKCYKIYYNDRGMGEEVNNDSCDLIFEYADGNVDRETIKKINAELENYW